jgi:Phage tail protein
MVLADGQWSYNGLTFGEGCPIMVNRADGFEGFESRTSDADQPRADGALRGVDYVAPRTVSLELNAWEPDGDGSVYEALWASVRSAFAPSRTEDSPLVFKRPGQPERLIYCRPIVLTRSESWDRFGRYGYPPVVLRAVNPRLYSTVQRNTNLLPYASSSGGMDWPVTDWPIDFTGGFQTETVIQNDGTADAFPLLRFYGPTIGTCTGVTVTNSTTGQVLQISTTLLSGQILTADMEAAVTGANRLVVDIGGSSRYGSWALPRAPFAIAPGSNTLRFQITGTSTDVVCNIAWRSTWMD